MKHILIFLVFVLYAIFTYAQTNLALHLDGKDNNVRTGIGIIKAPWTIEAWIKGNNNHWRKTEVIIGGGEYSDLNIEDNLPLVVQKGRIGNTRADLWSKIILDTQWHHVALSCDSKETFLYLDGKMINKRQISFAIIPGALGVLNNDSTVFGGLLDEVRIWHSALSAQTIKNWIYKPLMPNHESFNTLVAYYNFDDGIKNVCVNWVGFPIQLSLRGLL